MANKLTTDILVNLSGNLTQKARQYGGAMKEFASGNSRAMNLIRSSTAAAGRGLDALGNRYVAFGAGLLGGTAMKGVADFEAQMVRLGTNAKLTTDQVDALKNKITEVSNAPDIKVDYREMATAADTLLGLTGNVDFVNENLENAGLVMQGFGADANTAGQLLAQFYEKNIRGSDQVRATLDQLYGQFAVGSASVEEIARASPKLFSIIQGKGPAAIAQMGGLVQIFKKTKGSTDEAVTSLQAVFASLNNKKNVEFLRKQGIDVFKKGTKELKEPVELLMQILDRAKYDPLKLGDVFDQTGLQGLSSLYSKENRDLLLQMVNGQVELGETQKASAKNAATYKSAMVGLNNEWSKFADRNLAEPVKELAAAIQSVSSQDIQNWLDIGRNIALAAGGLVAIKKGVDAARWTKGVWDAAKGSKSGPLGGAAASLGATPVYVVNMPGGGLGGGLDELAGGKGGAAGAAGKASKLAAGLAAAGTVAYGATLIPEFSPVNVSRSAERTASAKNMTPTFFGPGAQGVFGLNANGISAAPGLMDVIDEIKGWLSGSSPAQAPQQQQLAVDVKVSDDRVSVKTRSAAPGMQVRTDTGPSLMP